MRETPAPVLAEWRAVYDFEPWADEREELFHGRLCSLLSSCHGDKVKPEPPFEFMPYEKRRREKEKPSGQTQEEMKAVVQAIVAHCEKAGQRRKKKKGKGDGPKRIR